MGRKNRTITVALGISTLSIGLTLSAGCDAPSTTVSTRQTEQAVQRPPTLAKVEVEPTPLQRIDPPDLVQLTEFTREQFDPTDTSAGPQLALPELPARGTAASPSPPTTSVANGETFMLIEQAAATADDSPQDDSRDNPTADSTTASGTRLPWGPSTASSEMAAVAKRAEETARRGYELAERGGMYSARARFTESLRIVAEALDAQRNTTGHTKSLAAGLRALEEVDDFVPRGTQIESSMNMFLIIDSHRTPVLKDRSLDGLTSLAAQRLYLTYAQEQLTAAGGDQSVASLALHGLGKICTAPAQMHGPREQIAEAKAVVYFQAAVQIEPRNFMSANELGVLLAKFGRLDEARHALEQAVARSNAPPTWRNLAVVNERLGDTQKAMLCRQNADAVIVQARQTGTNNAGSQYSVRWVDQATFAQSNSMVPDATPAATKPADPTPPPTTAAKPEAKSSGWKWPWR